MKRYEGLFILNLAGREDNLKDVIDRVSEEIRAAGGKLDTVQKMDRRSFARVTNKQITSGHYVNFIFEGNAETLKQLNNKFELDEEVYRILFTVAPKVTVQAVETTA